MFAEQSVFIEAESRATDFPWTVRKCGAVSPPFNWHSKLHSKLHYRNTSIKYYSLDVEIQIFKAYWVLAKGLNVEMKKKVW